jgi:hypothetical protein
MASKLRKKPIFNRPHHQQGQKRCTNYNEFVINGEYKYSVIISYNRVKCQKKF